MKKVLSIAVVALMVAGGSAFAGDCCGCSGKKAEGKKAECAKKADCDKKGECGKKCSEKEACKGGGEKKAECAKKAAA